jgi:protein CpxP
MSVRKPLLAAALFTGVAALGVAPALAQNAPAAAPAEMHHQQGLYWMPGRFVAGRIAFLRAELHITPAQQAQWRHVAAAMRQNARALDHVIATARQHRETMNPLERLALREQFAKVRADNIARLLAAFKPLYAGLSPQQKDMAGMLIGLHRGWQHRA